VFNIGISKAYLLGVFFNFRQESKLEKFKSSEKSGMFILARCKKKEIVYETYN